MDKLEEDYRETNVLSSGEVDNSREIRPHDRIQIVGWVGLFVATLPTVAGIIYLGSPKEWQMDQAIRVLGITGCLTATYLFAGGFLVVRGLQSRPVQGDAIRFLNLVIVAPILVVLMAPLLSPLLVPLFGLAFHNQFEFMPFAVAAFSAANSLLVWVVILRQRRAVWESVRRWLDPTIDCHQP